MPPSIDVNLPKSIEPKWPDTCVGCDRERPEASMRLWTHSIGWWTWMFWFYGKPYYVDVPVCQICKSAIKHQRWLRWSLTTVVIIGAAAIGITVLKGQNIPFKKWIVLAMAIIAALPFFIWETIFPPAIDITAYGDSVDFEFRDAAYARNFAKLNNSRTDE